MIVRALTVVDAASFRDFRLAALEESPQAFAESVDEFRALSIDGIAQTLRASSEDNFVLGSFADEVLVGTAGFSRNRGKRTMHKGRVWGVYVDPTLRGKGIGRKMMEQMLAQLRHLEGLRQISLSVAASQTAAIALYESLGFKLIGVEQNALRVGDNYVDEELRVLRLAETRLDS